MCGILFSLSSSGSKIDPDHWKILKDFIVKRGPDSQLLKQLHVKDEFLEFFSTVLHLRGPNVVPQPIEDSGNVLCWNGEIFGGLKVTCNQNDTEVLMNHLKKSKSQEDILSIFSKIEGPYTFVYWQASEQRLWFGRDCLGRRSLLISHKEGSLVLSSVGLNNDEWEEVQANGIYCIDLSISEKDKGLYKIDFFPWNYTENPLLPFPRLNATIPSQLKDVENPQMEPSIDSATQNVVDNFISVLSQSVKSRVADIPYLNHYGEARVAILFSGGIDCTFLAALADRYLPKSEPIDLLNVAFENLRSEKAKSEKNKTKKNGKQKESSAQPKPLYDTPDRITGRNSLEELKKISPDRVWNFVEINVPYTEALEHRQHIIDLMFPLDTVMDLSIAMAFWFASRGKGIIKKGEEEMTYLYYGTTIQPYCSLAKVLISGLGADEQLGGYSRHREAFRHGKWDRLVLETQLDIDRISTRNLGRDDRIMSDHGKEIRFPFLCTNVVNWLCSQPIYLKVDPRYERGIGEKILLRHAAREIGLENTSKNWKRAIQFGAKTAKMTGESRTEKGQHKLT